MKLAGVRLHSDCQGEDSCSDGCSKQAGYYEGGVRGVEGMGGLHGGVDEVNRDE